jgi:hypothetical protein
LEQRRLEELDRQHKIMQARERESEQYCHVESLLERENVVPQTAVER